MRLVEGRLHVGRRLRLGHRAGSTRAPLLLLLDEPAAVLGLRLRSRGLVQHLGPEELEFALHDHANAPQYLHRRERLALRREPPHRHRLGDGHKLEATPHVLGASIPMCARVAPVEHVVVLTPHALGGRASLDRIEARDHASVEVVDPSEVMVELDLRRRAARQQPPRPRVALVVGDPWRGGGSLRCRTLGGAMCHRRSIRLEPHLELLPPRVVLVKNRVEEVSRRAHFCSLTEPAQPATAPAILLLVAPALVVLVALRQVSLHGRLLANYREEAATCVNLTRVDTGIHALREEEVNTNLVPALSP